MTRAEFNDKMDKVYKAIRKAYGYTDEGDELVDFVIDATDREYQGLDDEKA